MLKPLPLLLLLLLIALVVELACSQGSACDTRDCDACLRSKECHWCGGAVSCRSKTIECEAVADCHLPPVDPKVCISLDYDATVHVSYNSTAPSPHFDFTVYGFTYAAPRLQLITKHRYTFLGGTEEKPLTIMARNPSDPTARQIGATLDGTTPLILRADDSLEWEHVYYNSSDTTQEIDVRSVIDGSPPVRIEAQCVRGNYPLIPLEYGGFVSDVYTVYEQPDPLLQLLIDPLSTETTAPHSYLYALYEHSIEISDVSQSHGAAPIPHTATFNFTETAYSMSFSHDLALLSVATDGGLLYFDVLTLTRYLPDADPPLQEELAQGAPLYHSTIGGSFVIGRLMEVDEFWEYNVTLITPHFDPSTSPSPSPPSPSPAPAPALSPSPSPSPTPTATDRQRRGSDSPPSSSSTTKLQYLTFNVGPVSLTDHPRGVISASEENDLLTITHADSEDGGINLFVAIAVNYLDFENSKLGISNLMDPVRNERLLDARLTKEWLYVVTEQRFGSGSSSPRLRRAPLVEIMAGEDVILNYQANLLEDNPSQEITSIEFDHQGLLYVGFRRFEFIGIVQVSLSPLIREGFIELPAPAHHINVHQFGNERPTLFFGHNDVSRSLIVRAQGAWSCYENCSGHGVCTNRVCECDDESLFGPWCTPTRGIRFRHFVPDPFPTPTPTPTTALPTPSPTPTPSTPTPTPQSTPTESNGVSEVGRVLDVIFLWIGAHLTLVVAAGVVGSLLVVAFIVFCCTMCKGRNKKSRSYRKLPSGFSGVGGSNSIEKKDLFFGREIGRGGFGVVYEGMWRNSPIAIKQLRMRKKQLIPLLEESELMQSLRHPRIISYIGTFIPEDGSVCILTEFAERGSLKRIIRSKRYEIEPRHQLEFLKQIAQGMDYLHHANIIHRDLKCDNILVSKDWSLKVSDFGLSKHLADAETHTMTMVGTPAWTAPEVLRSSHKYSLQADIYSYSITIYEILTGHSPYKQFRNEITKLCYLIAYKNFRPIIPDEVKATYPELLVLLKLCWNSAPDARPSFHRIGELLTKIGSPQPTHSLPAKRPRETKATSPSFKLDGASYSSSFSWSSEDDISVVLDELPLPADALLPPPLPNPSPAPSPTPSTTPSPSLTPTPSAPSPSPAPSPVLSPPPSVPIAEETLASPQASLSASLQPSTESAPPSAFYLTADDSVSNPSGWSSGQPPTSRNDDDDTFVDPEDTESEQSVRLLPVIDFSRPENPL